MGLFLRVVWLHVLAKKFSNPIKDALQWYSSAIKLGGDKTAMNTYHKNRAACYIKLENYDFAVKDSVAALGHNSNDSKALFRKGPFQIFFQIFFQNSLIKIYPEELILKPTKSPGSRTQG